MNKSYFYIYILLTAIFFTRCQDTGENNDLKIIDYGKPSTSYTTGDIIDENIDFIKLETTKDCTNEIKDDLAIGGFPPPIYSDNEKTIGLISTNKLFDNKDNIKNDHLKKIINTTKEEDNPILAIYKITTNL